MLKSFRSKAVLWYCSGFAVLSLLLMATVVVFVYMNLYRDERAELAALSTRLKEDLVHPVTAAHGDTDLRETVKAVNDKLSFVFDEEDRNFGYAVFSRGNVPAYTFQKTEKDPFADVARLVGRSRSFFAIWASYKDVTFYRWDEAHGYRFLVSSTHHLDLIDDVFHGFLLMLPVWLLMSLGLGSLLGRKVSGPLRVIAATAAQLQKGDLGARIQDPGGGTEVEQTVGVLNAAFSEIHTSFDRIQQFGSDVAHELKTPLTAIRGSFEVALRRPRLAEEYPSILAEGIEDIAEITQIVDGLLLLSRPGSEGDTASFEPLDLGELVDTVMADLQDYARDEGVHIRNEKRGHGLLRGNRIFLKRMMFNLLHNAVKFTPDGGTVTLTLDAADDGAVIEVRDTGIGLDQEQIEKIFDRLYQADPTRREGHGLGLSIVQWIVDLHGGQIHVESRPREGSVFRVTLPLDLPSRAGDPVARRPR